MPWMESDVALASLPVIASLGTLAISQRYSRRIAEADRSNSLETARQDRLFQAREARYADRRATVAECLAAANDEVDAVVRFEREHHHEGLVPFDLHEDYEFSEFSEFSQAYARLAILVPSPVVEKADYLRSAVYDRFAGKADGWQSYNEALLSLQSAAREMLNEDTAVSHQSA
ncbi:hypothetical protein EFK50_20350 [Nocardioides marmoriginsengisoli]|uniref:DUF4760 domain-containing protein n=1 Tax=Nocardioides marmoriginsengisoli TaxID=661483 RepID=A0A3N0CCF2_9ACTN|nr:hypothetical protein [Nocardioides marmoriginsengisoli]RNL60663.1 hypothetical protein EFK50_20350 [Nocardioides marmoriginsengisoli]